MTLLQDIEEYFKTKDLYLVLKADKNANQSQLKKAYHKASLCYHPDRHSDADENEKKVLTAKFQILSRIYHVLSDEEQRKLYDDTGVIADEDDIDNDMDWCEYWRTLFPKVKISDIEKFLKKYIGSEEEKKELINLYERFEGDLDMISCHMIDYEEERTKKMIEELIENGEVEAYDKFVNEPAKNKKRRITKLKKEERLAKKAKEELDERGEEDLIKAIQSRRQGGFESMISNLEAKYGGASKSSKKSKRRN